VSIYSDARYDDVKAAITTVISAIDTTCPASNIHDYRRWPVDASDEEVYRIFGKKDATQNDVIHAWMFDCKAIPKSDNEQQITAGNTVGLRESETWEIEFVTSLIDGSANTDASRDENGKVVADGTPTARAFQKTVRAVKDEFWRSAAIRALEQTRFKARLASATVQEFSEIWFHGTMHCHYARLNITFDYPKYVIQ
jgi:hypothetical protein